MKLGDIIVTFVDDDSEHKDAQHYYVYFGGAPSCIRFNKRFISEKQKKRTEQKEHTISDLYACGVYSHSDIIGHFQENPKTIPEGKLSDDLKKKFLDILSDMKVNRRQIEDMNSFLRKFPLNAYLEFWTQRETWEKLKKSPNSWMLGYYYNKDYLLPSLSDK